MRTLAMRVAAGLAAVALSTPLIAAPAAADPVTIPNPDQGLVFYSSNPLAVVARQAAPDDVCRPFPADADWLLAWSGFQNVIAYKSADCSGQAYGMGIWRGWTTRGTFGSYKTV
ncbi:hypothetical protein [Micromonospora chalcea]|uniref:hypothetical protein n=1 Tax=Micromonospora chalcea TaxID=1874 RepID=UPI0004C31CA0|nr:hypothetical protein [Micromonospora purpureochromogenes]